MTAPGIVALHNSGFDLLVEPARGGSIVAFRRADGTEIFRNARPGPDATGGSCFPMVPFCNRVRDRRFEWQGQWHELAPNTADGRQTAHGFGWRTPWSVARQDDDALAIRHDYHGADWPWDYRAEQCFRLRPDGLSIALTLTNLSATAMPAGLGLHPYLPLRPGCRIGFAASQCDAKGADGLAVRDPGGDAVLAMARIGRLDPLIGNRYFSGFAGEIVIHDPTAGHLLMVEPDGGCTNLALHVELDAGIFCIEPMSHGIGALNQCSPADLFSLEPQKSFAINLVVRVLSISEFAG